MTPNYIKEQLNTDKLLLRDFNTPLSSLFRSSKIKASQEISELRYSHKPIGLTSIWIFQEDSGHTFLPELIEHFLQMPE